MAAVAAEKNAFESDPKARLHVKASVKVLQVWLNSPDVAGPIVYTAEPVAAAFGVAPVAGVLDEARSGVGALIAYHHGQGNSSEVLRVVLARCSVPLTQAVVFGVCTSKNRKVSERCARRRSFAPGERHRGAVPVPGAAREARGDPV